MNKKLLVCTIPFLLLGVSCSNKKSKTEILAILQNDSFSVEGDYSINNDAHHLHTVLTKTTYYLEDCYDGTYDYQAFCVKDGFIYGEHIDKNNNYSIEPVLTTDGTPVDESHWEEECGNPFLKLDKDNITNITSNSFELIGEEMKEVIGVVTGWYDQLKKAVITKKGNHYVFDLSVKAYDGDINYKLDLNFGVEAKKVKYEEETYCSTIENAFGQLRGKKNYTITNLNKMTGEEDIISSILRVNNIYYDSYDKYGYVMKDSGVYMFNVKDGEITNVTKYAAASEAAKFELSFDFSGNLFNYDPMTKSGSPKDAAALCMVWPEFAYSIDRYSEYRYANSLVFSLNDDGTLNSFKIDEKVYNISITNIVGFTKIGTTELPFDASSLMD